MNESLKKLMQYVNLATCESFDTELPPFTDGYQQAMQNVLEHLQFHFPEVYQEWSDENYSGPKEIKY